MELTQKTADILTASFRRNKKYLFLIGFVLIISILIFSSVPPQAVDWHYVFYPVSQSVFKPYSIQGFINPPWITIILYPFHFLSEQTSLVINATLNFTIFFSLIYKKRGNLLSILLTFTSYPFISSVANGTIEWIPALGFFFPNALGIILILTKPQVGLLAGIDWFIRKKNKVSFIGVPALWIGISFLVWKNWPMLLWSNAQNTPIKTWNMSLFPWLIPIGILLVFYMVRYKPENGELFGVIATFCFVPYWAVYSLTILFVLSSIRYPRLSFIFWILLWLYPIIRDSGIIMQILG